MTKIVQSEQVYQGKAFSVQRKQIHFPDDRLRYFDCVEHPGAVTLVPVDAAGRIVFVSQYRVGVEGNLLELPAGTLEKGEAPDFCAAREIREEIGMAAGNLQKIGAFYMAPGYSTEFLHIYLATNLYAAPLDGDEDEFIKIEALPVEQVYRMVKQGEIQDGKTLASLLLAQPYL